MQLILSAAHKSLLPNSNLHLHSIPPKHTYHVKYISRNKTKTSISVSNNIASNDVIVVGAGVAGSALAYALAMDGRRVHMIERSLKEPNKIAGEMLQPAGYLQLLELGLDDCVRGIDAQVLQGYVFSFDRKSVTFPFPLDEYGGSNMGARTFHHGRFVQKLRYKAASLPNVKLEQGTATSLIEERGIIRGVRYKNMVGDEIATYASLTVVSDGCFSSLRKFLSKPKINKPSHIVCVTVESSQTLELNHAHLIMGNPLGLYMYPISSTEVRCGVDIPGPKLPSISNGQMAHFLKTKVAPQVPAEIRRGFISSVENDEIRVMPVNCMIATPHLIPGALLLGDSLNMRHALLAGGMTVALNDVSLLRNLFAHVNLEDTSMLMKHTQYFYNLRKPMAFTMNIVADCMHKVVYTCPDELRKEIWTALFNYCYLGEVFIKGPTELISGLRPDPWTLLLNLFASTTFVCSSMIFPVLTSPSQARAASKFALDAWVFLILRLWEEDLGQVFFPTLGIQQKKLKR